MSSLKVSLAQLGLVTLTAGALASPAYADFSPLEQPLEGDSFVSVSLDQLSFVNKEASSLVDQLQNNDKHLTVGTNLFQDGPLVAGLVSTFTFDEGKISKTPFDAGAYLAYQDVAEDGTGLQLGALVSFESDFGIVAGLFDSADAETPATPAAETPAATRDNEGKPDEEASDATDGTGASAAGTTPPEATVDKYGTLHTKFFESYTLAIAEVGGNPVFLKQTATLTAKKDLAKKEGEQTKVGLGLSGGLAVFTKFDKFAPALSVGVEQASFDVKKTNLSIGGELGFQATDSVALKVNASAGRAFGEAATIEEQDFAFSYGAGLAFQASESVGLALDVSKAKVGVDASLGLNLLF